MAAGLCLAVACVARAEGPIPEVAPPPWYQAYGYNITNGLLNPLAPGGSAQQTRRQIAGILYDARMAGATVVRWITTDVWPHWRYGSDPENRDTGDIDPAWFALTRILLQEAQRQHVRVVVSLSNLSNGGHPEPTPALSRRFVAMATHLARFEALAAIEFFNEPDFRLTHSDEFWATTHALRKAIRRSVGPRIALYSGVAAWDAGIIAAAKRQGDFADEAVLSVHDYQDFTLPAPRTGAQLQGLLTYLQRLAPGKPLIISEFGSAKSLTTADQHQGMVDASYQAYAGNSIGLWVWGSYFPQPAEVDYKWDFNHRSVVGAAYRRYAFDEREDRFAGAGRLRITPPAATRDPNAHLWVVTLDGAQFAGLSRAGVFPKYAIQLGPKTLPTAATTYFLGRDAAAWLVIRARAHSPRHDLAEYHCEASGNIATPPALLGLSVDAQYLGWAHTNCPRSRLLLRLTL